MFFNSLLILYVSSWTLWLSSFISSNLGADRTSSSTSCGQKVQTFPSTFSEGLYTLESCIRVVEKHEYCGEDGGLSPLLLPSFLREHSRLGGLELSPCNLVFLSS